MYASGRQNLMMNGSCHNMPCRENARGFRGECENNQKPPVSKAQLLRLIHEVSFAVDDIVLYLDTHPCDQEALEYFRKYSGKRNDALREYAKHYGPLTIDTADDARSDSWDWVMQPWPWEGGAC
jgi:spore coat protein JB